MKPWWSSKTLVVNAVALAASIGGAWGFGIDADAQAQLVGGIMAVVNIALRLMTTQPVTARRRPGE